MLATNEQLTFADLPAPKPKLSESEERGQTLVDKLRGINRQAVQTRKPKPLPIVPAGTPGPLSGDAIPF